MRRFTESRARSFGHAFEGWSYVLRTQRNAWLHVAIALAAFAVSAWVGLDALQWAIIVLTTGLVFVTEFLNTAIELVVDLASPQVQPLAKLGKDVAAGAVLLMALTAALTGILILGPPLLIKMQALVGP